MGAREFLDVHDCIENRGLSNSLCKARFSREIPVRNKELFVFVVARDN